MLAYIFLAALMSGASGAPAPEYNKLTAEERRVIIEKGTERPWSGKYVNHKADGVYVCKRCDAPLFQSGDKFDSHCGWPSFDDALEGAIKKQPDADGVRTEIVCSNCGAHLGHVFHGEEFTPKNTRHCVNSISLNFVRRQETDETEKMEAAVFAGGCFWGVEYYMEKAKGVHSVVAGFTGGRKESPSYEEVCKGVTGHLEAVKVEYDPGKTTYEELARLFFEIHDPTQVNGQGPDIGEQYRSVIFYKNEEQKKIALKLIQILKEKGYNVSTELRPASVFYEAEEYHQDYYEKKGVKPYCHGYTKRF